MVSPELGMVSPELGARRLVRRIEFCYTPKHGSWLNIAEKELSSLTRQCVSNRRFADVATLRSAPKRPLGAPTSKPHNAASTGK